MRYLAIAIALSLLAISPCFAEDGNNVADQLGDIMTGKGNTYGGVEVIKDNIIGPVGVKLWADVLIGEIDDDVKRDARGGIRLRIEL